MDTFPVGLSLSVIPTTQTKQKRTAKGIRTPTAELSSSKPITHHGTQAPLNDARMPNPVLPIKGNSSIPTN